MQMRSRTVSVFSTSKQVWAAASARVYAMTRSIGCKNEAKYVGKGISYCAVCDANFFEDFEIYVVGGNGIADALTFGRIAGRTAVLKR